MLEARYQKDLQIQKQVAQTQGTTLTVSKPTEAYKQPKQIQFKVSTVASNETGKEPGMECCDVRLTTISFDNEKGKPSSSDDSSDDSKNDDGIESRIESNKSMDIVFFRLGHFMYKMLNQKYMV